MVNSQFVFDHSKVLWKSLIAELMLCDIVKFTVKSSGGVLGSSLACFEATEVNHV